MGKHINKILGQAPGTLIHIGERKAEKVTISIVDYSQEHYSIKDLAAAEEMFTGIPENTRRWINISGLHEIKLIEQIGEHFGLHPIALENIVNTNQRTGCDDFDSFIHIIAKHVYWNHEHTSIISDHVSIIIGDNYLITFLEKETDIFKPILNRLKNQQSKIRKYGIDYLGYSILDLIIDNYFAVIEDYENKIEIVEEYLISKPSSKNLREVHHIKRDLIFLRKSIWPLREVIGFLQTTDSKLIKPDIDIYIKNLYNHTIQIMDVIETLRDIVSGMLDIYLSSVSNEMNKVMKVLTIIATIFIPLTFIAGIYGMNFDTKLPFNMPELHWRYGYLFALGLMGLVALLMVLFFKKKKWF